jgi:hypothetical protein
MALYSPYGFLGAPSETRTRDPLIKRRKATSDARRRKPPSLCAQGRSPLSAMVAFGYGRRSALVMTLRRVRLT